VVQNGFEHQLLGLELGIDVLVGIDVLPEPQNLLSELDVGSRHTIDTQACNAGRGDGLKGGLHAVEVDVVTQGHDSGNVILHHLRILHAVIKHAKLRLEQWIEFQSLII
jgi:hypothetical protein